MRKEQEKGGGGPGAGHVASYSWFLAPAGGSNAGNRNGSTIFYAIFFVPEQVSLVCLSLDLRWNVNGVRRCR